MPRYKLTVAYDGTTFHGWQRQAAVPLRSETRMGSARGDQLESASGEYSSAVAVGGRSTDDDVTGTPRGGRLRTVQGILEDAVRTVVREPVSVLGASRTDAGVHARGQVAAFSCAAGVPLDRLPLAINSRLPDDVQVVNAEIVADDFDPIGSAIAKGYRYRLAHSCARRRRPLFDRHVVAHTAYKLDPVRMNLAARLLLGEHDFTSFARLHHGRESAVRTIYECKVVAARTRRCRLEIAGNGFLYNMIRIIMGTLVEIGRGVMEPQEIVNVLAARDRRAAGPTMPPEGLCLMWVRYPP